MDDTDAVERLAEQLGVVIGEQHEDPEQQDERREQHELRRLKDNIHTPISQGSTFNVLEVGCTTYPALAWSAQLCSASQARMDVLSVAALTGCSHMCSSWACCLYAILTRLAV